ncbi:SpaA isopeptide-forming pilin-related protein [Mollicutes bacterium LVI A0078]|nr:SpaA isopeptide-forming pilin-related protein [Mollicutes bacterium LVI A0075]WOO90474.1 SpaA isopeptide-forming pilin-related protein [Mollicutes bacterium LVI A0078]
MNLKFKTHKLFNMFMLVLMLSSIFAQPVYGATELASEVKSSQVSEVKEEEAVSEVSETTSSEEVASEDTDDVITSEDDSETEANAPPVEETEVVSEVNEVVNEDTSINTDMTSEVDTEEDVIDLTNMSMDEIAKFLDPSAEEQNFITLNPEQLKQVRGVSLTKVTSDEDYSVINSSMFGEWEIYKANGHYIFCIQPGADVLSTASITSESGSKYNDFSTTSKRYVGRVISSSMQHYSDSGNNDYVFAGQLLIWDYLSEHEADVIGNPMSSWNPAFLDSWTIHNSSEYGSEINTIEDDLDVWTTRPSFTGSTSSTAKGHTLKYNAAKDNFELTLTDTNGVWDSKFADYGDFGNYTVSNPAGANNVKITTSVESTSYTSARSYSWKPYASGTNEFYDGGQDLVYVGADPVPAYMKFKTEARPLGGFKIKKVDSETGAALSGAEFTLYDSAGSKVDSYTTNSNGIISVGLELPIGDYKIKETKAPTGYVLNNTEHSIKIEADKINDLTSTPYENDIIRGGIELKKLGEVFELDPEALANIEFTVTSTTYPSFNEVYKTNNNGVLKTSNDEFKYGDYHIEETKAPSKYVMDFEQDFSITKDGVIVKLNGGDDVLNKLYLNKVHFTKIAENFDNEDDEMYPLSGSTFGFYTDLNENGQLDREDKLVDMQTSDENGEVTSIGLPEGHYVMHEIEPTEGYNINTNSYPFEIKNDGTIVDGGVIELGDIENEVITGKAQLIKVGSKLCDKEMARPDTIKDCQTLLPGVQFAIYQDLNTNGEFDKQESKPVDVITTDDGGLAVTEDLKYGHYFVKEVNNPADNYFMNDNVFEFTISEQDEMVFINNGIAIENIEKLGNIHITKSGNEIGNLNDDTVLLADAEYTIYNSKGDVEDVLTTDENGEATSKMLSFGDYIMKETKAPEGYVLDDTEYEFTIDSDTYENTIEFDLTDEVIENEVSILKTDLATGEELPGAELNILEDNGTGTIVDTWVSTTEAHVINLEFGNYIITETATPEGYLPLAQAVRFSVTEDGIKQDIKIDNELITNEIHIKKIDVATGEEIPGAHLQIIDRNTKEVVDSWVSTTEEHISTIGYGNYSICEQIAPVGYYRMTTCVNFDVTEDGIVQSFKIENEAKRLAMTGGDPVVYAAVGIMSVVLIGAIVSKRKLNKE